MDPDLDCTDFAVVIANPIACAADTAGQVVSQAASDGLEQIANDMMNSFGTIVATMGTMWAHLPTPDLTSIGSEGVDLSNEVPWGAQGFQDVLSWVAGIALAICVASLIAVGIALVMRGRSDDASRIGSRVFKIAGAVAAIAAAPAIIALIMPYVTSSQVSGIVAFTQNATFWWTAAIAMVSVVLCAVQVVLTQRTKGFADMGAGLARLIVVGALAVPAVSALSFALDGFSNWVLFNSTAGCDVASTEDSCFGNNVSVMVNFAPIVPLGAVTVILLGAIAWLAGVVQIGLLFLRIPVLILLAGVLPLLAAGFGFKSGQEAFSKGVGWMVAFIVYKPIAALIYAIAFTLFGTDVFRDDGTGLLSVISGVILLVLAAVSIWALIKVVVPAVGAIGGGGGMAGMALAGAGIAAAGQIATGAIERSSSKNSSSSSNESQSSVQQVPTGSGMQGGPPAGPGGAMPTSAVPAGAGAGTSAGASVGAGAGAAAAGPVGVGVAAAAKGAKIAGEGVQAAAQAAQGASNAATGSDDPQQR